MKFTKQEGESQFYSKPNLKKRFLNMESCVFVGADAYCCVFVGDSTGDCCVFVGAELGFCRGRVGFLSGQSC